MFPPFRFSFQRLLTVSFFSSFSSSSSSLHILHNSFFFLSTKTSLSFLFSHSLTLSNSKTPSFSHFLSKLSSSLPTAPKTKKTSYILSSDAFHLTHLSEATRLIGPPLLTYRPENHIPMAESVSFQTFSHFQFSL